MSLLCWLAAGSWLVNITRTLATGPVEVRVVPVTVTPPASLKEVLLMSLGVRFWNNCGAVAATVVSLGPSRGTTNTSYVS